MYHPKMPREGILRIEGDCVPWRAWFREEPQTYLLIKLGRIVHPNPMEQDVGA